MSLKTSLEEMSRQFAEEETKWLTRKWGNAQTQMELNDVQAQSIRW